MTDKSSPPAMPMLGNAASGTFMGVPACKDIRTLDADVAVVGIPCATPYKGAEDYARANLGAPNAIRASLDMWAPAWRHHDYDLGGPPFLDKRDRVADLGNLPLDPLTAESNRKVIRSTIETIVGKGAVPIVLGGEDSVPDPVIAGLGALKDVIVVQVDAHIDWRDEVNGERHGLSSVMRRASENPHVTGMIQIGMRGLSSAGDAELAAARAFGSQIIPAEEVHDRGIDPILERIPKGANVHVNLDLDGLDSSIMPAVFVPSPGGLTYWHVVKLIRGIAARARLASFAMVELMPSRDPDGRSAFTAGRIAVNAIGSILRSARS